MCGGLFSFCFLHETVFGNGQIAITHNIIINAIVINCLLFTTRLCAGFFIVAKSTKSTRFSIRTCYCCYLLRVLKKNPSSMFLLAILAIDYSMYKHL